MTGQRSASVQDRCPEVIARFPLDSLPIAPRLRHCPLRMSPAPNRPYVLRMTTPAVSSPKIGRMPRYDALIVGAGPAGSGAAYRLARAGVRVLILDGSHPREKPCGGGVTGRALALVHPAVDPGTIASVNVSGATFTHG